MMKFTVLYEKDTPPNTGAWSAVANSLRDCAKAFELKFGKDSWKNIVIDYIIEKI